MVKLSVQKKRHLVAHQSLLARRTCTRPFWPAAPCDLTSLNTPLAHPPRTRWGCRRHPADRSRPRSRSRSRSPLTTFISVSYICHPNERRNLSHIKMSVAFAHFNQVARDVAPTVELVDDDAAPRVLTVDPARMVTKTPQLLQAIESGDIEALQRLLRQGADIAAYRMASNQDHTNKSFATTKPSHVDLGAMDQFCRRHLDGDDHVPTGCMGISRVDLGAIGDVCRKQHA